MMGPAPTLIGAAELPARSAEISAPVRVVIAGLLNSPESLTASRISLGISEALINTAMGLTTAILASFLYNFFTTRVDAFNNRVDETSYEVLKLLETGKES